LMDGESLGLRNVVVACQRLQSASQGWRVGVEMDGK
jgi:hypothetical protein